MIVILLRFTEKGLIQHAIQMGVKRCLRRVVSGHGRNVQMNASRAGNENLCDIFRESGT